MKKSVSYQKQLIEDLTDPAEAAAYLNAALRDGDSQLLLLALRNVVESQGGMSKVAKESNLNRANLYQMLSQKGNPRMQTLEKVLGILGMKIAIVPDQKRKRRR